MSESTTAIADKLRSIIRDRTLNEAERLEAVKQLLLPKSETLKSELGKWEHGKSELKQSELGKSERKEDANAKEDTNAHSTSAVNAGINTYTSILCYKPF